MSNKSKSRKRKEASFANFSKALENLSSKAENVTDRLIELGKSINKMQLTYDEMMFKICVAKRTESN